MRIRWMAALTAMFLIGGAANAQPAKAEPTLEVRLRSVNDLIDKAEYIAGLAGQEQAIKQVRDMLKQMSADGKGIEGIDPKRPFGLTATLSGDVISSPLIVMIPIADQDRFLKLLKDRLEIVPEKVEGGALKAFVPIINEVYLRFSNDYVYIGRSVKDLDPKVLATPKTFFAKDDGAVGSVLVRFDGIPADLKAFVLGQFELGISEQRKKNGEMESPAQKAFVDWVGDNATSALKTFLDDAKELQVRVFIDEKADNLSGEITFTSKSGSTLAKNIASLGGKTSLPAAIVGAGKDSVGRFAAKAGLPDGVKKELGKVVDAAFVEILKDVPEEQKPILERILKTLAPTLKAGELDVAAALNGPDSKGQHTLIAAIGVKNGKEIEKLVKDLVKDFGPFLGDAAKFDFDVETIGAFKLHTVTIEALPPEVEKLFGTKKIWLATSEDHIALSIEPDGAALKAGLKAKPAPATVLSVDVAFAKLVPLVGKDLKPDEVKALLKDAFGDGSPVGKDTLSITITGGDQLTVKGSLKGKGIRLLTSLEQFKIK
ncbi:MAG: hypothetical protein C0467_07560 [Planctomycetaceae bacterium]|nr:hypothetical protein [Planctomycetaceae bacterium]